MSQFAINYLGHYQLTIELWPALKKSGQARVISLSSAGHRHSDINFIDINYNQRTYNKWEAYGQSKTAISLFTIFLDRIGVQYGIRAFAVSPGAINTNLSRSMSQEEIKQFSDTKFIKSPKQVAATSVWCACSNTLNDKGGVYCSDVNISKVLNSPGDMAYEDGVLPYAIDYNAAKKLMKVSEDLTGLKLF